LQSQQGGFYAGSATHWGPEINFGRTLYRAGVRDFGIIKVSRGGGGNSYWLKGSADDHMYRHVVDAVTNATATLTAAGHTFDIVGLLYLQGESDSTTEAAAAGTRFKTLVDNLRTDLPNAGSLFGVIGGIAAANATRDIVRANHRTIADSTSYIDYFSNLDLQAWTASDALHFNKAAKLRLGERYALAFCSARIVSRKYGKLVFIGDSITQGGNGNHPSYRYTIFKYLAGNLVTNLDATGYKFTGSISGAYQNGAVPAADVNGQAFENIHDGHFGWRASWICARIAIPAGRYNLNNLGSGTVLNWTGQTNTYLAADAGSLTYTGTNYTPDTVSIMIGINDLADGVAETQVRDDIGTLIDQLRASNPNVCIFLNKVLHTNQGATRDTQVNTLNGLLPALVATKNADSTNSPVWLVDADTGFVPATMTYDAVHPNASGELYVGDRIAATLGLIETPMPSVSVNPPPYIESGSEPFSTKFEGTDI
jgi:lysophospholipase L1-like esterase